MNGKMNYVLVLAIVIATLSLTHGAPQMRRHRRHWSSKMTDDQNYPHYPHKLLWNNSCGHEFDFGSSNPLINNMRRIRVAKPLKPLREAIPNFLIRLNAHGMQAIDTSDVSQWFSAPFNSTYEFLHQINGTSSNIYLRKRHTETQVYVGAFQYLLWKQRKHDHLRNEDNSTSVELGQLLVLAKNLLCEIEAAIYNTGLKMPAILTREQMEQRLTFRNNNHDRQLNAGIDDIDSKFAKVRFSEYLHGLQQVLKNRRGKTYRRNMNKSHRIIRPQLNGQRNNIVPSPIETKRIDQTIFEQVLRNNDVDGATKKHRKNGQKKQQQQHNRLGLGKQRKNRKNQKQFNDQMGKRNHRRNNIPKIPKLSMTTIATNA